MKKKLKQRVYADPDHHKKVGQLGGLLGGTRCMETMTPTERSERARKAAAARWDSKPNTKTRAELVQSIKQVTPHALLSEIERDGATGVYIFTKRRWAAAHRLERMGLVAFAKVTPQHITLKKSLL